MLGVKEEGGDSHNEVETPELLYASAYRGFEALDLSHIDGSDPQDFGARPRRRDVGCHAGGLFLVAPDDAGVGAQVHHGPNLGAAYGAGTAGTEDDFVCCVELVAVQLARWLGRGALPKSPSFQTSLRYSPLGRGIVVGV